MKTNILAINGMKTLTKNEQKYVTGGATPWGYSYACDDGTGFSTVGPNIDEEEAANRCGAGGYKTRAIYTY